jgi:DNA-binding beta-propeller fold protein YncE
MGLVHQVVIKSFNSSTNTSIIIAGTGCPGMASHMLDSPRGIFVDISFNLYVADASNNRIQFFPAGQLQAKTVAGNGASGSIVLNHPSGIILDADRHLFIADEQGSRIVASGSDGFRCLFGCSGPSGSAANQLLYPYGLSFDSYGNIFVTDENNNRIQKFLLATNSCGK